MQRVRKPPARWVLFLALVGVLLALMLALAANARAQGLDRLDAHTPPDLIGSKEKGSGFVGWLEENKTLLLVCFGVLGALLVLVWLLGQNQNSKRLQRDALEKLRKSLIESCKATRGPAKRVLVAGSPRDPVSILGRYAGHHRSVDAMWIAYRPWLFGQRRLICTNPVDVVGLDADELQLRAVSVNVTRGLGYAVPDVSDDEQRRDWQSSTHLPIRNAEEFSAAWKAYYAHAIDNAIAFYDALNAVEDRSFLRQEVTRSREELTETIATASPQPASNQEASNDA